MLVFFIDEFELLSDKIKNEKQKFMMGENSEYFRFY